MNRPNTHPPSTLRGARLVASLGLLALVAFYLLTEHLQHTLGALPWILLVLFPLMHLLMHRGHGHSHSGPGEDTASPDTPDHTHH